MYRTMIFAALFLAVLCHPAALWAQDADTFVRDALSRHPRIQAIRHLTEAAKARVRGAGAWAPPELSFEFFATPVTSLNPFRDGMENDWSLTQMIHFPGKLGLMERMAADEARMREMAAPAAGRDLEFEIRDAWAMTWMAQRKRAVLWENRRILEQILSLVETRIAAGRASQADALRLVVERDRLLNEDEAARLDEESGKAMLRAASALPVDYTIGLLPLPLLTGPDSASNVVDLALRRRSELRAMDAERTMRATALEAARKERYPDFMVRGMYKQMLMMDQTDQWALMIGITLPMAPWSSARIAAAEQEAALARMAVDRQTEDMRLMIAAEVHAARERVWSTWTRRQRIADSMLPQSRRAVELQITQYQAGSSDLLPLLDALRMHTMIAMDQAMADGEYLRAQAALGRVTERGGEE